MAKTYGSWANCTVKAEYPNTSSNTFRTQRWNSTFIYGRTLEGFNPRWRIAVKEGINATSAFSTSKVSSRSNGDGQLIYTWRDVFGQKGKYTLNGTLFPPPTNHLLSKSAGDNGAVNAAKTRLVSQFRNNNPQFLGGVVLGELGKTLRMIKHPAESLRDALWDYYRVLKKVPRGTARQRRRQLNNAYLEATYGWRPLISDINNGFDALDNYLKRTPFITKVFSAVAKSESSAQSGQTSWDPIAQFPVYGSYRTLKTESALLKVALRVGPVSENLQAASYAGLLPENFLPSAWELMPYSFFIDYFTNIGAIIDAASFCSSRFVWGAQMQKTTLVTRVVNVNCPNTSPSTKTSQFLRVGSGSKLSTQYLDRVTLGSIIPTLEFRLPGFGTKTSLNIASLVYAMRSLQPFY